MFKSRPRHRNGLKNGILVTSLPKASHCIVNAGTGWRGVSVKRPGEKASLICNFYINFYINMAANKNRLGRYGCLFVGCLTSQQHASVSQGRICSDNFTCYHTEIQVADKTFHLTQSQYTNTGSISLSADPITPGAWQGSH